MMSGVSIADLQDAILCLKADMDDMEYRFQTVCRAYARTEIAWAQAKKALQEDIQQSRKNQADLMQMVSRLSDEICDLKGKVEPVRIHGRAKKNHPNYGQGSWLTHIGKNTPECSHNSIYIRSTNQALDNASLRTASKRTRCSLARSSPEMMPAHFLNSDSAQG